MELFESDWVYGCRLVIITHCQISFFVYFLFSFYLPKEPYLQSNPFVIRTIFVELSQDYSVNSLITVVMCLE